jgi:hypothetical protein
MLNFLLYSSLSLRHLSVNCNFTNLPPFMLALLTPMLLLMLGFTGVPGFLGPLLLLMPLLFPMFTLSCVPTVPDFYLFGVVVVAFVPAFASLPVVAGALDVAEVFYVVSELRTVQSSPIQPSFDQTSPVHK